MPIVFAKRVVHPGVPATPYLRPAFKRAVVFMRKEIKVEVGKGKFKTLRGLERRLGKVVKKSAFFAEALARQFAPKRTRNLARHINARKVSELHWTVGTNVEYAAVQEFGSRKKDYVIRPRKALALRFKTRGRRSGGRRNRKRGRRR